MKDLKIKIENNIDEIIELMKAYGCKHFNHTVNERNYAVLDGGVFHFCKLKSNFNKAKAEEVTIQQLRDLVVLKRNDKSDASHVNENTGELYRVINGAWHVLNEKWELSSRDQLWIRSKTKPIEPKMKEFLNTKAGYLLQILPAHAGDDADSGLIEVPAGAEKATECGRYIIFWLGENLSLSPLDGDTEWCDATKNPSKYYTFSEYMNKYGDTKIIWQRDKPSLNDQYAEVEQVRQECAVNNPSHYTGHPSGIECIEITRHHDFAIGNAIKYLWRAGLKDSDNEIQDLKKAVWYIEDKIKQLEKNK